MLEHIADFTAWPILTGILVGYIANRISEATLLILAVIGGSIGALLGMKIWHHKTMHKKFKYGLPLILLAQIALIYFICNFPLCSDV